MASSTALSKSPIGFWYVRQGSDWPQTKQPLSRASRDYVLGLDIEADVRVHGHGGRRPLLRARAFASIIQPIQMRTVWSCMNPLVGWTAIMRMSNNKAQGRWLQVREGYCSSLILISITRFAHL
jgi:hypothetical protein